MFKYVKTEKTDFLLLNDVVPKEIDLGELVNFISQYMNCKVYTIDELINCIKPLFNNDSGELVTIGEGGELVSKKLLQNREVEYKKVIMHRKWQNTGYSFYYDAPFDSLNSNVHIIDDIIASGETLYKVREFLDPSCLRTFSATVLITSGNLNSIYRTSDGGVRGYTRIISALLVLCDSKVNPYWYPAIYSMRHLLFKQEYDPLYLERMSKRYFNGKTNMLRTVLESIKDAWLKTEFKNMR